MQSAPTGDGPYVEFGQWIRRIRMRAKHRSQSRAAELAAKAGLALITQGKLTHLERGWNRDPAPEFLQQLAELYEVDYADIVEEWVKHRFRVTSRGAHRAAESDIQGDLTQPLGKALPGGDVAHASSEPASHLEESPERVQDITEIVISLYDAAEIVRRAAAALELGGQAPGAGVRPPEHGGGNRPRR